MGIRQVVSTEPALISELCFLLQDVVTQGASVGFLAPLARDTADAYWQGVMADLGAGLRLWVAEEEGRIVGSVQLAPCLRENGRHRAEVQKLMVRSDSRRRGTGRALMATAEVAAAASGIRLLVLDTQRGSPAEGLYDRLGWSRVGEIPGYAASPDGRLHATVYFFKALGVAPPGVG